MFASAFNKRFFIAGSLFISCGLVALISQEYWLMGLPFFFVLAPVISNFITHKTAFIFYVMIALLPLSTEVNITPTLGSDFPDEILMLLLTGLVLLKIIRTPSTVAGKFSNALVPLLLLHYLWLIISCFYSMDTWLSVKYLLAKTWYIVPFVLLPVILMKAKADFEKLAWLLLLPMGLVVVQTIIRHAFTGFSFEGIKDTLWPFFRNHVTYSGMLVCLLPLVWAMYTLTDNPTQKRKLKYVMALGLVAIILAYSRGAWLALAAGAATYWLISKRKIKLALSITSITCLLAVSWLITDNNYLKFSPDYNKTIFHEEIADHLQATVTLKDVSNAERFYRWVAGGNMIADKPLTGFGPNTFYDNYKPYTIAPFRTWVSDNPEHSTVHNYFLLVSIEQGIPGLILFCLLYFSMIISSESLYHGLNDTFFKTIAMVTGIILVMIGCLIFMSDLIETDKIGSLFWLCLSILIVLQNKRRLQ